jgi:CHAT domain-containing protein/Tfp pilus assembly protein PilF
VRKLARLGAGLLGTLPWLVCASLAHTPSAPPAAGNRAAALLEQADRQKRDSHFAEAQKAYTAAREAALEANDLPSQAAALLGIGDTENLQGHLAAARQPLEESLAIREQLHDLRGVGESLSMIGNVLYAQGDETGARDYYERSLKVREEAGDRPGMAVSWNNLGNTLEQLGLYTDAAHYLELSEQAFEELGNQRNRGAVLTNLGMLYGYMGEFDRGLPLIMQGLGIARELHDDFHISQALNDAGVIHTWMGNYRAALDELNQSLKLREAMSFDQGAQEVVNNIGLVFQAQSDHQQSLTYFRKALALNKKIGDPDLEAESLLNVGLELLALGRVSESVREFRQSIRLSEAVGTKPHLGDALRGLGRAEMRLGNAPAAFRDFSRAAATEKEIGNKAGVADTTMELAGARLQSGDAASALPLARDAAELAHEISRYETLWQAKLISARILRRQGHLAEAAADLDEAIAAVQILRFQVAGEASALPAFIADRLEPYRERILVDIARGDLAGAFADVERSKAGSLTEVVHAGRRGSSPALSAEEHAQERDLENELASWNIRVAKAGSGETREKPADLRRGLEEKRLELESFQSVLTARHPELAIQRGAAAPLTLDQAKDLARVSQAVILDYIVTRETTYLFLVQPAADVRMFPIHISAEEIKRRAFEFRRQIASHDLSFTRLAQELHTLLLAPASAELARYRDWIIVPDGALWDVPFQALTSSQGHYAIQDAAIAYAPSLAVLRAAQSRAKDAGGDASSRQLLAIGNPTAHSMGSLPGAEKQVAALRALYGESRSSVFTGADATEERFKAEAGHYRVIHLATHAVLDNGSPLYSRVLLASPEPESKEDGFLEAREMMDLDLHAEMVVLSGCETGGGKARPGEGITGMLWAMFVAGAPTTVASLWPVESSSTSELMVDFHRNWLASRSTGASFRKASAMRAAAQKLIATPQYSHPFYWAGFMVVGNAN